MTRRRGTTDAPPPSAAPLTPGTTESPERRYTASSSPDLLGRPRRARVRLQELPIGHRRTDAGRTQPVVYRSARCLEDLGEELLVPRILRVVEKGRVLALLENHAVVHEDDSIRRYAGEAHLMADHDHGHALVGELLHDVEHLTDHLRVQRGRRLIEKDERRLH